MSIARPDSRPRHDEPPRLSAKHQAHLAAATIDHLTDLEATGLGDPAASSTVGTD